MPRIRFRELKPYSLRQLAYGLGVNEGRAQQTIEELLSRGLIQRKGTVSDDYEQAEVEESTADEVWQFRFVGMILVFERVVEVYPKYFRSEPPSDAEMRQILRVIRRLPKSMTIAAYDEEGEKKSDRLALMLELLDRYDEYGIYENYVDARELNGSGVIDWNRTINRHLPLLSNGKPIYVEYETRKNKRDDVDTITRLHRAVLTECSNLIQKWGVGELLLLDEICLTSEQVDDFGGGDVLKWRLSRERSVQFVTWKLDVLRLMEDYLLKRETDVEFSEIHCLGTTSFYHVWELACKVAFGDKLDVRLGRLGLRLGQAWVSRKSETLLDIIPSPRWGRLTASGEFFSCSDVDTLIPDTVTFCDYADGERVFCIYDAKYYVPAMGDKPKGQPGVESIAKQFLYQSAYRNFVQDHGFSSVVNAFLVPTDGDEARMVGRVSFLGVIDAEEEPFSNFVTMWALPATEVFDAFLFEKRIDGDSLKNVWDRSSDRAVIVHE